LRTKKEQQRCKRRSKRMHETVLQTERALIVIPPNSPKLESRSLHSSSGVYVDPAGAIIRHSTSGVYVDPAGAIIRAGVDPDEILQSSGSAAAAGMVRFPAVMDEEKPEEEEEEELSDYSDEGIAGIDIPENILLEQLEFADNITSCNKVENVLMLSEYEQNLSKEKEWGPGESSSLVAAGTAGPGESHHKRSIRKWSAALFRNHNNNNASTTQPPQNEESRPLNLAETTTSVTSPPQPKEIPTFHNTARKLPPSHRSRHQITVIDEDDS